jgi:ribonuclease P protein component
MTPPDAQTHGSVAEMGALRSAVLFVVLAKRADFLRAASAQRHGTAGFLLQGRDRKDTETVVRIGYTASKKIGNAVLRNRAKRRLRALVRDVMPGNVRPGWDYVLVARPGATVTRPYADLIQDLATALTAIHKARP